MSNVFDTQYVIVVNATPAESPREPLTWVEGSKYGGTIWTGLRGQGGATAVARRAADSLVDDLEDEGWTDVAVHVLPVNANAEIEAGFPRPTAREEFRKAAKAPQPEVETDHERRIKGEGRRRFIESERALLPGPRIGPPIPSVATVGTGRDVRDLERVDL